MSALICVELAAKVVMIVAFVYTAIQLRKAEKSFNSITENIEKGVDDCE